ncbi:MAG: hypothetical protein QOD57_4550 [Actinomycetota bacterium]|nr:hypothetical protein [Actinomycetota bacterium]
MRGMEVDRNGLEILDRGECLRLLGSVSLGRVGFTSGALPSVLPVTFHLDGEHISVFIRRGSKLFAALQNAVVAFEADDFDPICCSGWSVAVTGVASEANEANGASHGSAGLEAGSREPAAHWAPVGEEARLAISTEFVSGRRITAGSLSMRP